MCLWSPRPDYKSGFSQHRQGKLKMFWRRLAHGFRNCFRKGWFQRRKSKQMNNEIVPSFPDGKEFTLFRETHPNVLRSMDDVAGGYAQIMLAMEQLDSNRDNEIFFLMV